MQQLRKMTKMAVTPFDPPYTKTPRCTQTSRLCVLIEHEQELLPIEVLHCGNRNFRPFGSCDLDLDPMTFIDDLNP